MSNELATKQTRIYSLDIMRIVAICAVLMIHISADFIKEYQSNTVDFVCGNVFNSLSRFAVPVFLMISGALMLNEERQVTTRKILSSALNLFLLLVIWNVMYCVAYNIIKPILFHEPIYISDIMDTLFNGHYHMWYLFVIIGLYLLTPILRLFIKKQNASLIRNYLLLSLIVCFCGSFINQIVNYFSSTENVVQTFLENYRLDYLYEYLTYYILGWYISNAKIEKPHRIVLYIGGLLGLVTTFVCTQLFSSDATNFNYYSNDILNVFLYSIAIFTFIHYFVESKDVVLNSLMIRVSNSVFGVFLIHPAFLFVFKKLFHNVNSSLLEILIVFFCSTLASFVFVAIISRIPVLKKLVRG